MEIEMEKKRKTKVKADLKSTRDILQQWNEYYGSNNFGIGIRCDKCRKWREVFQYPDESEIPETWICSMWKMDERRRASCRIPSDKTEADFVESLYSPGCLVWAKMAGYPPWPGMIEDCPDSQQYFVPYKESEHEYHVNYFGKKPLRNWIKASRIKDFRTKPPTSPKAMKNKDLQRSIEQANEALKMTKKERLKKFSFAVRYKGRWAKVKELDKVYLPPDCSKLKRKEKSTDSKPQVIAEETHGNRDSRRTSTVRKERKFKSKSVAATMRTPADKKKSQPTVSQKEKIKKNRSSTNQFADTGKDRTGKNRKSSRNFIQQLFKSKTRKDNKNKEDSPVHNDTTISSEDDHVAADNKKFQPPLSYTEGTNHSRDPFVKMCSDGAKEKRESPGKSVQELDKIETNGDIRGEDSPVHSDTTIILNDEDMGVDNDEFQPTSSHKEEIVGNNHSRNQLVGQVGAKEKQKSPGKCVQQTVKARPLRDNQGEDSPVYNDATISSNDEHTVADNDEFQPSASHKEEIVENNHSRNHPVFLCQVGAEEKRASCVQKLDKVETNGDIQGEDLPEYSDTTISPLADDEEMNSPSEMASSEHINRGHPSQVCDAGTESLSDNDTVNDLTDGNSDSAILREHVENFSERDNNINNNNAAELSVSIKSRVMNYEKAAVLSDSDSDVYILDTDPSLLRIPCPPRFPPENERISNRCERFKRNRELTDELVSSNNSRYMPYSFYRRRM